MDTDDLDPRPRVLAPMDFEGMSVLALEEYIEALEQEIIRAKAAIGHKASARVAAESFFKSR